MFFHEQELQRKAEPAAPDACFARTTQEILRGQHGPDPRFLGTTPEPDLDRH